MPLTQPRKSTESQLPAQTSTFDQRVPERLQDFLLVRCVAAPLFDDDRDFLDWLSHSSLHCLINRSATKSS